MNLLIVEEDVLAAPALATGLTGEGFDVTVIEDDDHAVEEADALDPGVILFDTSTHDERAFGACRALRRMGRTEPILFLSPFHGPDDRARGLSAGADDYIVKPFQFADLVERLRAQLVLRSIAAGSRERVRVGRLLLDMHLRRAFFGNAHIRLTQREAELLGLLMRNANRPVSRDEIYGELWGAQRNTSLNVVDVYIGYLRAKLTDVARVGGPLIGTVRGRGFMLDMAGCEGAARS